MVFIYILQLENNKYYVGKTSNPSFRLGDHFSNNGSLWTKKYKPIKVLELIPDCDNYDEDKYTIKYMEKYGINNVRGGSFCNIQLSDTNIVTLQQIITSVTNKCYLCGNNGHYAKECKQVSGKKEKIPTIDLNEKCDCPTSYFSGHRRGKCMLNKIIAFFDEEEDNNDKVVLYFETQMDKVVSKDEEKEEKEKLGEEKLCVRCGRNSHNVEKCYAKTHLNGTKLYDQS